LKIQQTNLITSLKLQPLIVVIRLENDFFDIPYKRDILLLKIKKLSNYGIKHIEIGWESNIEWVNLIGEIKNNFKHINIGVASIKSRESLNSILSLDINYSMSPFFNKDIHLQAIENSQLVIPGISNIKDFHEAINLGYKIIKIFPASKLGINFLHKLKEFKENNIFFIGAGGIRSSDIKKLLKNGYNALAIGRELKNQIPDQALQIWLKDFHKDSSKRKY
tara:strand:- start:58 stop:720 length:663 start_codon:yes stop_codon:yes gene_type:complete